ncbi:hypothetical protein TNCV_3692271 [Trichonephila clavipes]|nr:hypothetical protein TNCV_3692271 [Trichonephila clavipes]
MVRGVISYHGRSQLLRIEAQNMQLFLWPTYSPDMPSVQHVGDLVGRRIARDPSPTASNVELWNEQHGIIFHKQTFDIGLTPSLVI